MAAGKKGSAKKATAKGKSAKSKVAKKKPPRKRASTKAQKKAPAKKKAAKATQKKKAVAAVFSAAAKCSHGACENSALILDRTGESCEALHKAFELAREARGGSRGMTTDEEQDLLRSMLVMSAAGLDAMSKQLVRDALPQLIERNQLAQESFEKFLSRQLRPDSDAPDELGGAKFLAKVLASREPQDAAIDVYVRHLTRGSLQSSASLYEVAAALGLWPDKVGIDRDKLDPIFDVRNKIIHELDINLSADRRNRNVRRKPTMVAHTKALLATAQGILKGVDGALTAE